MLWDAASEKKLVAAARTAREGSSMLAVSCAVLLEERFRGLGAMFTGMDRLPATMLQGCEGSVRGTLVRDFVSTPFELLSM
jgi:hypothetical protein